jgi:hypothetical protein
MEKALAAVRACINFYQLFHREPGEIHAPFSSILVFIISLLFEISLFFLIRAICAEGTHGL